MGAGQQLPLAIPESKHGSQVQAKVWLEFSLAPEMPETWLSPLGRLPKGVFVQILQPVSCLLHSPLESLPAMFHVLPTSLHLRAIDIRT